jgi:hypothetical protein
MKANEKYVKLYGASDDLIEIEGDINDEIDCYDDVKSIEASDGTKGKIWYNNDGVWQISISKSGTNYMGTIPAVGEDDEHTDKDAIGCTSYSDVAVWKGIDWIKIGRRTFN